MQIFIELCYYGLEEKQRKKWFIEMDFLIIQMLVETMSMKMTKTVTMADYNEATR